MIHRNELYCAHAHVASCVCGASCTRRPAKMLTHIHIVSMYSKSYICTRTCRTTRSRARDAPLTGARCHNANLCRRCHCNCCLFITYFSHTTIAVELFINTPLLVLLLLLLLLCLRLGVAGCCHNCHYRRLNIVSAVCLPLCIAFVWCAILAAALPKQCRTAQPHVRLSVCPSVVACLCVAWRM